MSIDPLLLISSAFGDHTRDSLNGAETLYYYIFEDHEDALNLAGGTTIDSSGHSGEEITFVESIFLALDPLIGLDFERKLTRDETHLDIYCVDYVSTWEEADLGEVFYQGSGSSSYWDLAWKDTNGSGSLIPNDKNTIIHEIGHVLGLSHPNEDPFNALWDTDDTVMSYVESSDGWDFDWSVDDISALQQIWGVEQPIVDPAYATAVTNPFGIT
ncbi:MAG: hypothetical protein AB8E87_06470, partial [Prochlorococcus sp.]